ncbi:MAG TPA: YwiC-like family protein [Propionibacteriaceae bacterium]|nr:YwiC-like family protein [Propionibacteriaceae bacterium]HPZ49828.1 YwiC-like family protein [Propionibacteriaceae bacterium]HQE31983.1 YwiC-like family protein [Propionibacteriaceae bacterium]
MSAEVGTARSRPLSGRSVRTTWAPKQHGAWAMLVTPWLLGSVLAARSGEVDWAANAALLTFWIAAYLLFQAASTWLKAAPRRRSSYALPVQVYGAVAGALGALALWLLGVGALAWVPLFLPLLGVALWLAWRRRERSLLGGVVTIAAACLLGLVARHPQPALPDATTTVAVAAAFAYFTGTILYVKTILRERGKRGWLVASVGFHAAATLVAGGGAWMGGGAVLVWLTGFFAVCTARAVLVPWLATRHPVTAKAIGMAEIGVTIGLVAVCLLPG